MTIRDEGGEAATVQFSIRITPQMNDEVIKVVDEWGGNMQRVTWIRKALRFALKHKDQMRYEETGIGDNSPDIYVTAEQVREIIREELRNYEPVIDEK